MELENIPRLPRRQHVAVGSVIVANELNEMLVPVLPVTVGSALAPPCTITVLM